MTAVASPPSNEASATPRLGICDRTKQVRDAIVAKIAGVGNCTQVTDAHMAKIKGRLRLENTKISSLQAGDFAGLPNLRVIHLHGNRLSSLPPDVFDGLSSLEELDLRANRLTTLPSDVFDGLSSLIWLDLSTNQLSTLPSDVFDGLSSLEWLILWENQLNSLPSDVFGGLSSLTKLNLRANRLSILPSDVFDGLSSLENLDLRANRLSSLPSNVFDGLSSLRELNLRTNRLSILPSDVFDGLSSLTRLDLRANRLSSLPSDVFDGLSSLEGLLLDRNQLTLTGLPSDVFDGLSSLEMLNLQHNRLSSLPDGVFEGLSSLEWLLLYENPVDPMPLTVSLEKVGDSGFKATVLAGAPFTMTFPVGVTNGNIVGGATTLTIPVGAVESGILSVTRAVGTTDAVTVDIGAPLPRLRGYHQGYALAKATDLPREILADDETPLTARVARAPAEHNGWMAFRLRIAFSEPIRMSGRRLRSDVVSVAGGRATKARPVKGRKDRWDLTVKPDSRADVTVTLAAGAACDTPPAVCTKRQPRRPLTTTLATTVRGPVALSVADARAEEGTDETLDFVVSLSRAASWPVRVAYATADGTARAGADYTRTRGTLRFAPGETVKTVRVPVLDDAHDEGEETLTLRLPKAFRARLADRVATGTIKNEDPLQRAWLARFGRTVGTHVTDAISDRLRGGSLESHLTIGGQRLPFGKQAAAQSKAAASGATDESGSSALRQGVVRLLGLTPTPHGSASEDSSASRLRLHSQLGQSQTLQFDLRRILLGSSFRLALGAAATDSSHPRLTAWGRFAGTQFDGNEPDLSLEGDVLTGTVGIDGAWDRLLLGMAVAHSRGDGSWTGTGRTEAATGDLKNTLTSFHPYLRYAVTDRVAVWGTVGYGWGQLEVEEDRLHTTTETDTDLLMGAFGGRGILLSAGETGGFELATRTDAMLTRTSSDAVATADGRLESADAEAHRLRLVLEGSRGFAWAEGRSLTPRMEVGLRHDWGDAETGFGLELGGRVRYADPALGLTIEGAVRGLLAHEDSDYEEWGASGSLRLDPGSAGQGLALTLAPTWGAASSGVDGLWSRQTTAGLAQNTQHRPAGRLNAEVGYGLAAPFGTGLLTPYAGAVLSDGEDRTYRVGGRLHLTGHAATGLALNLEGTRQEPAGQQPVNQGLRVQTTWSF